MKILKKLGILFVFLLIFMVPVIYAGTAYTEKISIDAKLNQDGSMLVTETIVFDIEGEQNGVFREILLTNKTNPLNGASKVDIGKVSVDGKEFIFSTRMLQNGESDKYNINNINNGKQIKIFVPSNNQKREIKITYILHDVVIKYNDIAELYWNFIGSGWDYGADSVDIAITLPGASNTLKIYGHGPLNGVSNIESNNKVTLKVDGLRSKEQVDARVLFDTSLVPTASKVVDENKLNDIIENETVLANKANAKRETAKILLVSSLVAAAISIVLPIYVYIKFKKKIPKPLFDGEYYRELPEDYGPAIMNKVIAPVGMATIQNDMLATLLDLVRRKYVEIENLYKDGKKKPYDYKLKLVNKNLEELNQSERHFVENMIFVNVEEITLKELKKKNSKTTSAQQKAYKELVKWTEKITNVSKEKELLKQEPKGVGKNIAKILISLVLVVCIIIVGVGFGYEDIMAIGMSTLFICILETIVIIIMINELNLRTEKGIEHKSMWLAFKKFLTDFSKLDEHSVESMAIWEHYLVYAAGLGITKKVIDQLKIVYPTEFTENNNMFGTYMMFSILSNDDLSNSFSSAFTSAAGSAFSSPSSGSGSGGGFSGGGGGRRRRRRRGRFLSLEYRVKRRLYEFIYNAYLRF